MLSEIPDSTKKRKDNIGVPSSSGEEEVRGSDEESNAKKTKFDHESPTIMKVSQIVEVVDDHNHLQCNEHVTTDVNNTEGAFAEPECIFGNTSQPTLPYVLPTSPNGTNASDGQEWMKRYNNVRKTLSCALYPSVEDVQWLNEQITEMRKSTLSPER